MNRLPKFCSLHNPDDHPTGNSVITVDGDIIRNLQPVIGGGDTTSAPFGDGVVQQTFLGIKQVTGVRWFFPRQAIKHALTSVFNIRKTSCEWTFNYKAHRDLICLAQSIISIDT